METKSFADRQSNPFSRSTTRDWFNRPISVRRTNQRVGMLSPPWASLLQIHYLTGPISRPPRIETGMEMTFCLGRSGGRSSSSCRHIRPWSSLNGHSPSDDLSSPPLRPSELLTILGGRLIWILQSKAMAMMKRSWPRWGTNRS